MKTRLLHHRTIAFLLCSSFLLTPPVFAQSNTAPQTHNTTLEQREARKQYDARSLYALHLNIEPLATYNDYLKDSWFAPHHGQS